MKRYKLIKEFPGSPKLGTIWDERSTDCPKYPEFWELIVKKDYEILSLFEGKFIYPCDKYSKDFINQLFNTLGVSIHSVKRKDGEVFTIGDKVSNEYVNNYTINKIGIVNDECMVSALYDTNNPNGSRLHYNLNNLKKVKQPLFTTENGVDIFEDDKYYYINRDFKNPWNIVSTKADCPSVIKKNDLTYKRFSTKEKAEEYILMNKPVLSLNDIFKDVEKMRKGLKTFENSELAKRFKKLVKQKLNK